MGRRLQITNLSFQVEYKKDEESFLLFEVQMLHLATVVRKSTIRPILRWISESGGKTYCGGYF